VPAGGAIVAVFVTLPSVAVTVALTVKVTLPPLVPLRHEQFGVPALVRRGEIVTLLAESEGLRVTTNGQVREDAPQGARVRVVNQSSQTEVVGRVVNATTIAVAF
jgi:flagella basal body P-ring formation protein FlgA